MLRSFEQAIGAFGILALKYRDETCELFLHVGPFTSGKEDRTKKNAQAVREITVSRDCRHGGDAVGRAACLAEKAGRITFPCDFSHSFAA